MGHQRYQHLPKKRVSGSLHGVTLEVPKNWRLMRGGGYYVHHWKMLPFGSDHLLMYFLSLHSIISIYNTIVYSKEDFSFPKNVDYYFTGLFIFCYKRPNGKHQIWKFAEWWCSFFLFQLRTFFSRWFTPKPIWNGCNRICKRRTCPLSRRMTLLEKTREKC